MKEKKRVRRRKEVIEQNKRLEGHLVHSRLTLGQRAADSIAKWGGSWVFISLFFLFLVGWMSLNTYYLITRAFDPFPYILLNLVLSCLAAVQAPIILMSQNRAAERDRERAERDYVVNRKAEREVANMQKDLDEIKAFLRYGRKVKPYRKEDLLNLQKDISEIKKKVGGK